MWEMCGNTWTGLIQVLAALGGPGTPPRRRGSELNPLLRSGFVNAAAHPHFLRLSKRNARVFEPLARRSATIYKWWRPETSASPSGRRFGGPEDCFLRKARATARRRVSRDWLGSRIIGRLREYRGSSGAGICSLGVYPSRVGAGRSGSPRVARERAPGRSVRGDTHGALWAAAGACGLRPIPCQSVGSCGASPGPKRS